MRRLLCRWLAFICLACVMASLLHESSSGSDAGWFALELVFSLAAAVCWEVAEIKR